MVLRDSPTQIGTPQFRCTHSLVLVSDRPIFDLHTRQLSPSTSSSNSETNLGANARARSYRTHAHTHTTHNFLCFNVYLAFACPTRLFFSTSHFVVLCLNSIFNSHFFKSYHTIMSFTDCMDEHPPRCPLCPQSVSHASPLSSPNSTPFSPSSLRLSQAPAPCFRKEPSGPATLSTASGVSH